MDESPPAGRHDPPSPPPDPPPDPTAGWMSVPAAPPRRTSGKWPLGRFLVAGVMLGLAIGTLGLLVRGALRKGLPQHADASAVASPGGATHEEAGSAADAGSGEDDDLVPDLDPVLFHNRLEAVSGGTKPVWEEGAPATLVDFWASWCGPCLAELPHLQELQDRVEGRGMRVVLVNVDLNEATSAGRFLRRKGIRLDSLVDRNAVLFQAAGLGALPSTFVLDAKGRPVSFFEGGVGREELEEALLRANEKRVRESYR